MIVTFTRRNLAPLLTLALFVAACASVSARAAQQPASHPSAAHKSSKKHAHHARERGQTAPTPDRIEEIQAALARENDYAGDPNGKWDVATIEAMKKFQSANGLSPTGKIDALTLQKLGLGSEVAGKGAPMPPTGPGSGAAPDTQLR
jgi:peptidoglycan hydrolase-like protein with peptidoglycan-binding domain